MDVKLANPFIETTLETLETTASTVATPLKPYRKGSKIARGDISGVISLAGQYNATVSISFTKNCILGIVSKMFGEEMTDLNDEIKDAVGEISNMICGQVTTKVAEYGENLKATLKSVILEADHEIPHIGDYPVIAVPFNTDKGEFTIELCFEI